MKHALNFYWMHRIIIVSIALALCTSRLFAQLDIDRKLMMLEKEVFFSQSDSEKNNAVLKKLDYYFENKIFSSDVVAEAKRVNYSFISESELQNKFLWNACLLFYINDEKDKSLNYLNVYQRLYPDSSIQSKILGVLVNSNYDSAYVKKTVSVLSAEDSSLDCLICLNKINAYKRPHKNLYIAASAIIPGSGSMLNGNVLKGFNALVLNSSAGFAAYLLIKNNLYANAILLGGQMFVKFYSGNIRLTQVLFERKEEKKKNALANDCERKLKKVLEKYPLNFR